MSVLRVRAIIIKALIIGSFLLLSSSPASAAREQYSASVSVQTLGGSSSDLSFELDITSEDTISIKSQSVNIKTDAKTGYKLYLSTSTPTASLTNSTSPTHQLSPASGTHSNPAPLSSNSWGYAIPSGTTNSVNATNFDTNYNIPSLLESNGGSSKWAGLTPRTNPTLIHRLNSPTSTTGETFTINYAIKANSALPAGTYTNTILYTAVFEQYKPDNWGDLSYMQDMTPEVCAKAPIGSISSLADKRDQKVYDIIKATDGNCWMRENLALDLSPTITLTPEDTDVKQPWTPSHRTQTPEDTGEIRDWSRSINSARSYHPASPVDGNLYSFYAATANHLSNIEKAYAGNSFNHSICPRGWTLPGDHALDMEELFWKMLNYKGTQDLDITSYIPDVGLTKNGSYGGPGSYGQNGYYWTSIKEEAHQSIGFELNRDNRILKRKTPAVIGQSIRCIARGAVDHRLLQDITYMQEMNYDICSNTPEHTIKSLIDRRDNKEYRVLKAKDGNCWMVDNLDFILTAGSILDPGTTDVQSSWTPNLSTQAPSQHGDSYKWYQSYDESYVAEYDRNARSYNTGISNYGVLYNYHAATAGSGNLAFNNSNFDNAPHSVCPKHWQLPMYSPLGGGAIRYHRDFMHLAEKYGDQAEDLEVSPLFFVRSGQYERTGRYNALSSGNYPKNYFTGFWTARRKGSSNEHIGFGNHRVFNKKYGIWSHDYASGFAIRCVAR